MPARNRTKHFPIEQVIERLEQTHGRARHIARFDPMEELISCMLSQHTSDANSFPAFTQLRATFPTWQDTVAAGPEAVADVIRGAGLANQKLKSILGTLQEIHRRTGSFDIDFLRYMSMLDARRWLMGLPGVGPKTASIVLCFALGKPVIPVDTHIYRVSWRLGIIDEIGEGKAHDELLRVVPGEMAYRFHAVLIQHGRTICKAPLPLCEICPVTDRCKWYKEGGPQRRRTELAQSRKKK